MGILAELLADELGAAEHIRPLIVAAELHIAALVLEKIVEVVGLHYHIVELEEGKALLHALLIALGAEHIIDGEAGADLAQKVYVIQVKQPIGVVHHLRLAGSELDEFLHLTAEALRVVVDILAGEHLSHIAASAWVADHGRAAADKGDGLIARLLKSLHQGERHKMSGGEAVRSAVEAYIKGRLSGVDHRPDLLLVRDLSDKSSFHKFFINAHF